MNFTSCADLLLQLLHHHSEVRDHIVAWANSEVEKSSAHPAYILSIHQLRDAIAPPESKPVAQPISSSNVARAILGKRKRDERAIEETEEYVHISPLLSFMETKSSVEVEALVTGISELYVQASYLCVSFIYFAS